MAYTPYYAPYYRPMNYYNPAIPNDAANMANVQNQQPIQQTQQMPVQQPIQPMQMAQPTHMPSNDMLFVLNENEASAYPVAPNNSVVLWDKNNKTFYIKTANAQGVPSMQVYDFTERIEKAQNESKTHECTCGDKYATKEQINALEGKIDDLTAKYEELSHPVVAKPKTTAKKSKESEG